METRNVSLTLEKAKEFYNSGNDALREIALQAFIEEELKSPDFRKIKTFEDACKALNLDQRIVNIDINNLRQVEGKFGNHLIATYKLDIIRKALNGADWEPKLTEGPIFYSCIKFYPYNSIHFNSKIIATFEADRQEYSLVGGFGNFGSFDGIGIFNSEKRFGSSYADLGLLCCKSKEIAQYMSEQFGKIIFDACYAQHIGAYEWIETSDRIISL